jgi:hypothetical protein
LDDKQRLLPGPFGIGFAVSERIQTGKEMLVRIVAMLTKLVERFDPDQYRVRENASALAQSFEDEDEERQKAKGRSYLSPRQPACFVLPFAFLLLPFLVLVLVLE